VLRYISNVPRLMVLTLSRSRLCCIYSYYSFGVDMFFDIGKLGGCYSSSCLVGDGRWLYVGGYSE